MPPHRPGVGAFLRSGRAVAAGAVPPVHGLLPGVKADLIFCLWEVGTVGPVEYFRIYVADITTLLREGGWGGTGTFFSEEKRKVVPSEIQVMVPASSVRRRMTP